MNHLRLLLIIFLWVALLRRRLEVDSARLGFPHRRKNARRGQRS